MSTTSSTEQASGSPPALAIIGCGAIAKTFHVPGLVRVPGLRERAVLVDRDQARARDLGQEFGISNTANDVRDVLGSIDGAIIATPQHLHYAVSHHCIENRVHVLCEKPLAGTAGEVQTLADLADRMNVRLAVNNTRRLIPAYREIARLIGDGALGRLTSISYSEGDKFDWPSASMTVFGKSGDGKGVLLDIGAHALDLVCWWLGARPRILHYEDDSFGGSEAVASVRLEHQGCRVEIDLSWLSKLGNGYRLVGDRATIEGSIYDWRTFTLIRNRKRERITLDAAVNTYSDLAVPLIRNFADAIRGDAAPHVTARDVLPSIELIEACYAQRRRSALPWHEAFERILVQHG